MNERVERFLREEGEWMDGWMDADAHAHAEKEGREGKPFQSRVSRSSAPSLPRTRRDKVREREKDPEVKEF